MKELEKCWGRPPPWCWASTCSATAQPCSAAGDLGCGASGSVAGRRVGRGCSGQGELGVVTGLGRCNPALGTCSPLHPTALSSPGWLFPTIALSQTQTPQQLHKCQVLFPEPVLCSAGGGEQLSSAEPRAGSRGPGGMEAAR